MTSLIWAKLLEKRTITESGCWEWTGLRREGYGRVWLDGKLQTTHRLAAHLSLGLDLTDRWTFACHRCDNPPCFNPDHLFLGTPNDNNVDRDTKGRTRNWTGPRETVHARIRPCEVCGTQYEPDGDHRGRSRVCSPTCLAALRSELGRAREYKLTAQDLHEIRDLLARGVTGKDLASAFGVSRSTVSMIKNRKVWAHR